MTVLPVRSIVVAPSGTVTFAPAAEDLGDDAVANDDRLPSRAGGARSIDDPGVGEDDDRAGVLDEAADGLAELGWLRRNLPGKSDGQDAGRQCAYLHSICSRPAILSQRFDLHGP